MNFSCLPAWACDCTVSGREAVATTRGDSECLLPADFLLALGFTTVRPHPRTPRLRLDLRSTSPWREDVVEAALDRLLGRRRPVPLHREDPAFFQAPTNPGHS